ncbi:hypothetical protein [Hyalangium gracile]|uniref:hypothetical protein n=1 Tax=Hyalangium gracile TaxID=394092 RepID=UPI001CCA2647|nr:hypothetical protein [Hyalangium gracile]
MNESKCPACIRATSFVSRLMIPAHPRGKASFEEAIHVGCDGDRVGLLVDVYPGDRLPALLIRKTRNRGVVVGQMRLAREDEGRQGELLLGALAPPPVLFLELAVVVLQWMEHDACHVRGERGEAKAGIDGGEHWIEGESLYQCPSFQRGARGGRGAQVQSQATADLPQALQSWQFHAHLLQAGKESLQSSQGTFLGLLQ